ncbi:alanine-tRNA synthetase second additional domain-containing protein [Mycoplasmopsis cynos]|uniref:alanine-tRNA synthetase second additional domain-containing protein n=1 Tax=Mycoplasmopsis cynos TaxID=171284 RepID=UPI003A5C7FB3
MKQEKNGRNYDLRRGWIYGSKGVRIVKFDDITSDLCGGTHLSHTAKLENFKITNVEKKAWVYLESELFLQRNWLINI